MISRYTPTGLIAYHVQLCLPSQIIYIYKCTYSELTVSVKLVAHTSQTQNRFSISFPSDFCCRGPCSGKPGNALYTVVYVMYVNVTVVKHYNSMRIRGPSECANKTTLQRSIQQMPTDYIIIFNSKISAARQATAATADYTYIYKYIL